MKKTYLIPTIKVVEILPCTLLSGSPTGNEIKGDAPGGVGGFSRKGGFWDEEDDE